MNRAERRRSKALSRTKGEAEDIRGLLQLGDAEYRAGRLPQAMSYYDKVLATRPDHPDASNSLGIILCRLGDPGGSLAYFSRAIAADPANAFHHSNMGIALKDLKRLDEAVTSFQKALAVRPDFAEAHSNLGATLQDLGRLEDAVAGYRRAIALRPDFAEAQYGLGIALLDQGETAAAAVHLRRYLDLDPQDRQGAKLSLAAVGDGPMPARASEAHLGTIYARRSRTWDEGATGERSYRAADLVAEAVLALGHPPGQVPDSLDMLDAGCGTGLVGALLRGRARRLDGIDISPAMLERARAKGLYDRLHQGDLVAFLAGEIRSYDVIACAATLIHFGDLLPAFAAAAGALREDGLFAFTLFPNAEDTAVAVATDPRLARGGCYAHGRDYVRRLAETTGFVVERMDDVVHEYDEDQPIGGIIVVLRRSGGPS
ncbi:MAG: tetratricopeptide repeat protein [Alphaproteobacteria bacterium]